MQVGKSFMAVLRYFLGIRRGHMFIFKKNSLYILDDKRGSPMALNVVYSSLNVSTGFCLLQMPATTPNAPAGYRNRCQRQK